MTDDEIMNRLAAELQEATHVLGMVACALYNTRGMAKNKANWDTVNKTFSTAAMTYALRPEDEESRRVLGLREIASPGLVSKGE